MISDWQFLALGRAWPPPSESARLERYKRNLALFGDGHNKIYQDKLKRIGRSIGNSYELDQYKTVLNYQRLLSLKTADLLLGEPPQIVLTSETRRNAFDLNRWLDDQNFQSLMYQAVIDISRFGEAVLTAYRRPDGRSGLGICQPSCWFPVVNPLDIKDTLAHVIALQAQKELTIRIHYPGYTLTRVYAGAGCLERLLREERTETGIPGFTVIPLQGLITSDSVYGHDDYSGSIDSLVSDIMIRVCQIDRILDKHAMPSMRGPAKSIDVDPDSGEAAVKPGNYFVYEKDDAMPDYMTWDGQLESAFRELALLKKELYVLSELGGALLGDEDGERVGVSSARALRLRMVNPLAKVARIAANIRQPLREAIAAAVSLDETLGVKLEPSELQINWFDGLPNDEKEDTDIIQAQNGGKPTLSHKRSIAEMNDWDLQQAAAEYQEILEEEAATLPLLDVREASRSSGAHEAIS